MSETSSPGDETTLRQWARAIAAPSPSPAGGAAGAVSAALAAALVEMVAGMTGARGRYSAVHEQMEGARARGAVLREELLGLAKSDSEAFAAFERALALPKGTDRERDARLAAKRAALREGAAVQLAVLERTAEIAEWAGTLAANGLATAIGDSAAAGFVAAGAARSAYWAVRSNLQETGADPDSADWPARAIELLELVEAAEWRIRQLLSERVR